jgi:hypothetical protein
MYQSKKSIANANTLTERHPESPTWRYLVSNMLNDEPKLLNIIVKNPTLIQDLERDWQHTRATLRKLLTRDVYSAHDNLITQN